MIRCATRSLTSVKTHGTFQDKNHTYWDNENETRNGTERNETEQNRKEPEVIDAQYGRGRGICDGFNVSSSMYGELILRPVPATKTGQAYSRQYRATPSVWNILAVCLPGIFVWRRRQARGRRSHYRLWVQPWGVELPVAHSGTGREWYRILYSPQVRNKHHQGASAGMIQRAKTVNWLSYGMHYRYIYSSVY